jgi:hypothetical protein
MHDHTSSNSYKNFILWQTSDVSFHKDCRLSSEL